MDDVRGRFLGLPHGTTPAAVTTNKIIKMSSFKSSEKTGKNSHGIQIAKLCLEYEYKPIFSDFFRIVC